MFTVYHRFLCVCVCVCAHCMVISSEHLRTACVWGDVLMWPPYIIIYNVTN